MSMARYRMNFVVVERSFGKYLINFQKFRLNFRIYLRENVVKAAKNIPSKNYQLAYVLLLLDSKVSCFTVSSDFNEY